MLYKYETLTTEQIYVLDACRKFYELHVTGKSQIAEPVLQLIQQLYQVKAELRNIENCSTIQQLQRRQRDSQPMMQQLYDWLKEH